MMKWKLFIPVLLGFICLFGLTAPAYAAPAHSQIAKPPPKGEAQPDFNATGGGCQSKNVGVSGATIKLEACISGMGGITDWYIYPDGYITFPSSLANGDWTCTATVELKQGGTILQDEFYDCGDFANNGGTAHYGPINHHVILGSCPQSYYTELLLQEESTRYGDVSSYELSPYETITC